MMPENEDGAYRQVDQNSIDVFNFLKHLIQNKICSAKHIVRYIMYIMMQGEIR